MSNKWLPVHLRAGRGWIKVTNTLTKDDMTPEFRTENFCSPTISVSPLLTCRDPGPGLVWDLQQSGIVQQSLFLPAWDRIYSSQGMYSSRYFFQVGMYSSQGMYSSRYFFPVGMYSSQGMYSSRYFFPVGMYSKSVIVQQWLFLPGWYVQQVSDCTAVAIYSRLVCTASQ